jgi:hypothetical protein
MNELLIHPTERVPELVGRLYGLVGELEALFPGRAFTPDGHLVGSIGEVIAAYRYSLLLHTASRAGHDAVAQDGRQVEIKATQGTKVALRSEPQHLLVLQLARDGSSTEVFNGPGSVVWEKCGQMQKKWSKAGFNIQAPRAHEASLRRATFAASKMTPDPSFKRTYRRHAA